MDGSLDVLTRPAPPPDLRVRYGRLPDQVADVWLPASPQTAALVVVVHGGFWRARYDRTHTGPQCAALAAAGYVVASVEYRRMGAGGGWPVTFDDIAAAVDAVPNLVSQHVPGRVPTTAVVLVGHSAGGQLALWAASRHRLPPSSPWALRAPPEQLRGVVSLAGIADLTRAAQLRLGDGAVWAFLDGEPDVVPERYAAADPARLVPTGVPTVLIHGPQDDRVPLEVSERYADAASDDARLVVVPGAGHFELIDPLSDAWPTVTAHLDELSGRTSR